MIGAILDLNLDKKILNNDVKMPNYTPLTQEVINIIKKNSFPVVYKAKVGFYCKFDAYDI